MKPFPATARRMLVGLLRFARHAADSLRARRRAWIALSAALALAGCHPGHDQSAMHPAGPAAAEIATLWWVMFTALAAAFVIVMGLTFYAISRAPKTDAAPGGAARFVVISGIVVPAVILIGMLVYSLQTTRALRGGGDPPAIRITGYQWWWDVRYLEHGIVSANELYLPVGRDVELELRARDVVHSFWVPNLHGKVDMLPETVNRITLRADRPGTWRGQCAEFCGRQHALMALRVVALPPEDYERWLAERRRPAPTVAQPDLRRGEEVFFRASCHVCHAIQDNRADGRIGPDLTHLGSRLTLGAGAIENTREDLMRWIDDPQAVKPGSLMPRTPLRPEDREALVDYLQSLN